MDKAGKFTVDPFETISTDASFKIDEEKHFTKSQLLAKKDPFHNYLAFQAGQIDFQDYIASVDLHDEVAGSLKQSDSNIAVIEALVESSII